MLGAFKLNFTAFTRWTDRFDQKGVQSYLDVLLMGIVFALAFCPYAGVLYFGMLIPLTISSASGLILPVVFAIATGIPVILFAWLIAYSLAEVGTFYNRLKTFEKWFRKVIAIVFIGVGSYYIFIIFF
jgi:threonine/homoserine/homoserine lactone efflux protein